MTAALDLVIRSLVMLILAGAVAWTIRRRGAAVQSLVLTATLAGLIALPVAAAMLPAWRVTVWSVRVDVPPITQVSDSQTGTASATQPIAGTRRTEPAATMAVQPAADRTVAPAASLASSRSTSWPNLLTLLASAWIAGVVLLATRLLFAHVTLATLVRRGDARVDESWSALVAEVGAELGVTRPVTIRTSADLSVPIVTGVRRPVLMIPEEGHEWPALVRRDVVRHELAHVARLDVVGQLVGQLACALHWFNPLVWIAASRASTLRERACDDVVLRAGAKASAYAACLLDLASGGGRDRAGSVALAMARASRMRERIVGVLDPGARRETPGPIATAAIVFTALVGVVGFGMLQPTVRAESPADVVVVGQASTPPAPFQVVTSASTAASASQASTRPGPKPTTSTQSSAPAPRLRFCGGEIKRHSNSNNDNGRERTWKLRIEGPDCDVRIDASGKFEFNDAFTDLVRLDRDGSFFIEILDRGVRKSVDIRASGSGLSRTYRVDGKDQPWDAAAQAWFADVLIDIDRLTAIGVDHRFPRLYQQGGVKSVLAETALMPSDYARSRYYEKLLDAARLTPDERRAVIEQSARMTKSDYYSTELLKRVVAQGRLEDPQERAAAIDLLERMESDYYRSVVIGVLGGTLSADQLTALLKVAATIDSDYYRAEVLKHLLTAGALTPAQQALVLGAVGSMDSDYYTVEVLKMLAAKSIDGADARKAFLAAAYQVDSGFYKQEALSAFVRRNDLNEADLLGVIDASRGASDHYRAEILIVVLRNRGATDRVRQVIRDTAQSLSSSYRLRVYDAIR